MKEKVLYHSHSLENFLLIKNKLKENKVAFKDRIKRNDNWIRFFTQLFLTGTGSFGMNSEHKQSYYIYVCENDFVRAKELVDKLLYS